MPELEKKKKEEVRGKNLAQCLCCAESGLRPKVHHTLRLWDTFPEGFIIFLLFLAYFSSVHSCDVVQESHPNVAALMGS